MQHTPAPPSSTPISVTEPVSRAIAWTRRVLFEPFEVGKWFTLGFCAWLAWIAQGGGGSANWNMPTDDVERGVDSAGDWVEANLVLFLVLAALVLLLIIGLVVLLTWLSSRGKFMFLDGVIRNRSAVVEPWHRFRTLGDALFGVRVVIGLVALFVFGVLIAATILHFVAIGLFDGDPGPGIFLVLLLWVTVWLVVGTGFGLISLVLNDFVVPIMWLRNVRVGEAWAELKPVLQRHLGTFVIYVLMKIVLAIAIGIVSCLAVCLTCCLAGLPYIGTVILLPLFVFRRSYSIYFLSQFSPDYAPLAPDDAPPATADPGPPAGPALPHGPTPPGNPLP